MNGPRVVRTGIVALLVLFAFNLILPGLALASVEAGHAVQAIPPVYTVIPFVLLLLGIAILPLKFPHWWESNLNKGIVSAVLGIPIAAYFLVTDQHSLWHSLEEYLGFIVLLWSLYTISGGIVLRGNLHANPQTNAAFLAIGAVIANVFGTTGASMLLIRPLLRTNQHRHYKVHTVVFFIFMVSNIGGCLTPLGDPPLYMGFLRGIPFEWTLRLWPQWLFMNVALLAIYYVWDSIQFKKETKKDVVEDIADDVPLGIGGKFNLLLIVGVLATIVISGQFEQNFTNGLIRDGVMVALGLISMATTKKALRSANGFNFNAIIEVAVLFIGIFVTMVPALVLLKTKGDVLGVKEPWQFFWTTGLLSSFLDNTPTYLTFLELAQNTVGVDSAKDLLTVAGDVGQHILVAISLGAVFMGANTYIGNGPNFMVKAIAEEKGLTHVDMPSFGGYMLYSFGVLTPLLIIVTLLSFVFNLV